MSNHAHEPDITESASIENPVKKGKLTPVYTWYTSNPTTSPQEHHFSRLYLPSLGLFLSCSSETPPRSRPDLSHQTGPTVRLEPSPRIQNPGLILWAGTYCKGIIQFVVALFLNSSKLKRNQEENNTQRKEKESELKALKSTDNTQKVPRK